MKGAPCEVSTTSPCPHPAQDNEKWKSFRILTVRKKKNSIHLNQLLYINYHNMKCSILLLLNLFRSVKKNPFIFVFLLQTLELPINTQVSLQSKCKKYKSNCFTKWDSRKNRSQLQLIPARKAQLRMGCIWAPGLGSDRPKFNPSPRDGSSKLTSRVRKAALDNRIVNLCPQSLGAFSNRDLPQAVIHAQPLRWIPSLSHSSGVLYWVLSLQPTKQGLGPHPRDNSSRGLGSDLIRWAPQSTLAEIKTPDSHLGGVPKWQATREGEGNQTPGRRRASQGLLPEAEHLKEGGHLLRSFILRMTRKQ